MTARWLVALLVASACSQPQPPVDEERLARRIVALMRRDGLVVAAPRDGGAPTAASDDGEGSDEESAPTDEEAADEPADAPADPSGALAALAARAAANPARERTSARTRPAIERPTFTPAVITGDTEEARVWVALDGAAAVGPADALVTVVAFVDAECPFSARLYPMLREMQRAHAAEMRLVVRHRPLSMHRAAWGGAVFAEAARAQRGADGFFAAFDQLYARPRELDRATLDAHARALDLDLLRLADALDAPGPTALDRAVAADDALAESARVTGTPTCFVNGARVTGAVPREVFEQHFAFERDRAQRALARHTPQRGLYDALCRSADPGYSAPTTRRIPPRAH